MSKKINIEVLISAQIIKKPVQDFQDVIDITMPFGQVLYAKKGQILHFTYQNKKVCYILHSGSITLNRRCDGIVINSERAPLILGIASHLMREDNIYVKAMESCQFSRISLERFYLLIESYNLWKNLCNMLIYVSSRVFEHCAQITQLNSVELVCLQLKELISETELVRSNITAANYIQNRTYLSRSNIMRILSELRNENTITLHRGVLMSINNEPDTTC